MHYPFYMATFKPKYLNFFKIYSDRLSAQHYLILFGILVICTSFVSSFYIIAKEYYSDNQRTELSSAFEIIKQRTTDRLRLYDQILKGLTLVFQESSASLNTQGGEDYLNALNVPNNFQAIQSIGYIQILQDPKGQTHYSMAFHTSFNQNTIVNIDPEKNITLVQTLNASRDEANSVISKKNDFNPSSSTCIMVYPVYNTKKVPSTVMERQQNIKGFVFAVINFNVLFKQVVPTVPTYIRYKIFDGIAKPNSMLYETHSESIFEKNVPIAFSKMTELLIYNHIFSLFAYIVPGEQGNFIKMTLLGIIIIGALVTLLLYSLTWTLFNNRARALELFHAHAKLKAQYKTLKDITETNLQLRETDRLKSEFLANVSHELRTPLNAIIGFSEVLMDELPGQLNEQQKGLCNNILSSGHHLLTIINDLLNLSKIESGTVSVQLEMLNLSKTIEETVTLLSQKAQERNLTLKMELDNRLTMVVLDLVKLKQILFNLISNAIKFTPKGGNIIIRSQLINPSSFEISVSDTGIGISEKDLERLFQPFQQVDSSLSRAYEGTGLGLVMVKKLTELQGGKVFVKSEVGQGSCFTLVFQQSVESK